MDNEKILLDVMMVATLNLYRQSKEDTKDLFALYHKLSDLIKNDQVMNADN